MGPLQTGTLTRLTIVFAALAIARHLQNATGLSIKKIVHALRPIQQIAVRIAGHEHVAEDPITPFAEAVLDALGISTQWHTPVARVRSEVGRQYPAIKRQWETAWEQVIPFFAFPPEVRKVIYTTNMIESISYQLRKMTKTRGHFPIDDALIKLLYLGCREMGAPPEPTAEAVPTTTGRSP